MMRVIFSDLTFNRGFNTGMMEGKFSRESVIYPRAFRVPGIPGITVRYDFGNLTGPKNLTDSFKAGMRDIVRSTGGHPENLQMKNYFIGIPTMKGDFYLDIYGLNFSSEKKQSFRFCFRPDNKTNSRANAFFHGIIEFNK